MWLFLVKPPYPPAGDSASQLHLPMSGIRFWKPICLGSDFVACVLHYCTCDLAKFQSFLLAACARSTIACTYDLASLRVICTPHPHRQQWKISGACSQSRSWNSPADQRGMRMVARGDSLRLSKCNEPHALGGFRVGMGLPAGLSSPLPPTLNTHLQIMWPPEAF